MPPPSCPPVQNRHPPGNVGPLGTSSTSSMTEPSGNSPDEPVLVPPRQCPPLPFARKHRPSGNAAPWKRRPHGPRSDSMKEPPTNSADQPALVPPREAAP